MGDHLLCEVVLCDVLLCDVLLCAFKAIIKTTDDYPRKPF